MLISIYITNFNYGNYIEKAIKSAINQTYKSIEIIIIDDASKDISKKILNKYKKNKKIKIIYNKKKNGLVKSSNKAIKASREIRAGTVYINNYEEGMDSTIPLGGYKQSGIGRDSGYQALDNYLQIKSTWAKIS